MKRSNALRPPALISWLNRRHTRSAVPVPLAIMAGLVALFVAIPTVYILLRAAGADTDAWQRLLQARIWKLMGRGQRPC